MKTLIIKSLIALSSAAVINSLIFYALASVNVTAPGGTRSGSKVLLTLPPKPPVHDPPAAHPIPHDPPTQETMMTTDLDFEVQPCPPRIPRPVPTDLHPPVSAISLAAKSLPEPKTMKADQVDQPPHELPNPQPVYPRVARRRGEEGSVTVKLLINQLGRVEEAVVLAVDGHDAFKDAVLQVVTLWRFEPARHHGRPVSVWGIKTVSFRLRDVP